MIFVHCRWTTIQQFEGKMATITTMKELGHNRKNVTIESATSQRDLEDELEEHKTTSCTTRFGGKGRAA